MHGKSMVRMGFHEFSAFRGMAKHGKTTTSMKICAPCFYGIYDPERSSEYKMYLYEHKKIICNKNVVLNFCSDNNWNYKFLTKDALSGIRFTIRDILVDS